MNAAYKYDILHTYEKEPNQDDVSMLKSLSDINLYNLMGEDHYIWLQQNKKFGFNLEIDNENTETILKEEGIHPYAIESLAIFCKRFLGSYERICGKE